MRLILGLTRPSENIRWVQFLFNNKKIMYRVYVCAVKEEYFLRRKDLGRVSIFKKDEHKVSKLRYISSVDRFT